MNLLQRLALPGIGPPPAVRRVLVLAILCCACSSRPAVPMFTWHAVGNAVDELTVAPRVFEAQLDALQDFQTVSVHDAMLAPRPRSIVITFDDGTQDALDVVLPALRKRGMRAAFFIVTGFVGKPGYLDWNGVEQLRKAGMEIGSHGVSHTRLPRISDDQLVAELVDSRLGIEARLHEPCEVFAYPFASLRAREKAAAREAGYRWAVAGHVHGSADPYALYRIPVRRDSAPEGLRAAALQ